MKWLVCGGRDFNDCTFVKGVLDGIVHARGRPERVIHGGQRGVDTFAEEWAKGEKIHTNKVKPEWRRYGYAAGPIRNQKMLDDWKPDLVIAFPGGRGTADMVEKAKHTGVVVLEIAS